MKINIFRGDLSDISAKTASLKPTGYVIPNILCFHYLTKSYLDQSVEKTFCLLLITRSLGTRMSLKKQLCVNKALKCDTADILYQANVPWSHDHTSFFSVLAEISVRPPRKLFLFSVKIFDRVELSQKYLIQFRKQHHCTICIGNSRWEVTARLCAVHSASF